MSNILLTHLVLFLTYYCLVGFYEYSAPIAYISVQFYILLCNLCSLNFLIALLYLIEAFFITTYFYQQNRVPNIFFMYFSIFIRNLIGFTIEKLELPSSILREITSISNPCTWKTLLSFNQELDNLKIEKRHKILVDENLICRFIKILTSKNDNDSIKKT